MAEWKSSKKKGNFWHSPLALVVLFLILLIFSFNMIGLIGKERETNKNKISEMNKLEDLRARETNLNKEIERLNTTEGIEESVRDKFQVVKPGEKMVIIVDDDKKENPSDEPKDHGFWAWIKRLFTRD